LPPAFAGSRTSAVTLSIEQALREAQSGAVRPVYVISGEEDYLRSEVVRALRAAALAGGIPGLNEDQLVAGEANVDQMLALARTLPMMARRRLVLVRGVERWDTAAESSAERRQHPLDRVAEYAAAPAPETTLLLVATKLDKRRRLVKVAQSGGFWVGCDPLSASALPRWIEDLASSRGNRLAAGVGELVAQLVGPELAPVADAVERLCLYAGPHEVTEDDVAACLVRIRSATVWQLVDAVGQRDLAGALGALNEVFEPNEGPRLVGLLAWSTRQLLRFEAATSQGASAEEAAKSAGAPPFKARQLRDQVKRTTRADLETWLERLGQVDLALKGGSRRPAKAVLEHAIIAACRTGRSRVRAPGAGA
jgi:DNA polymerase III subunit delta